MTFVVMTLVVMILLTSISVDATRLTAARGFAIVVTAAGGTTAVVAATTTRNSNIVVTATSMTVIVSAVDTSILFIFTATKNITQKVAYATLRCEKNHINTFLVPSVILISSDLTL